MLTKCKRVKSKRDPRAVVAMKTDTFSMKMKTDRVSRLSGDSDVRLPSASFDDSTPGGEGVVDWPISCSRENVSCSVAEDDSVSTIQGH